MPSKLVAIPLTVATAITTVAVVDMGSTRRKPPTAGQRTSAVPGVLSGLEQDPEANIALTIRPAAAPEQLGPIAPTPLPEIELEATVLELLRPRNRRTLLAKFDSWTLPRWRPQSSPLTEISCQRCFRPRSRCSYTRRGSYASFARLEFKESFRNLRGLLDEIPQRARKVASMQPRTVTPTAARGMARELGGYDFTSLQLSTSKALTAPGVGMEPTAGLLPGP